jgi:hypothetical protein
MQTLKLMPSPVTVFMRVSKDKFVALAATRHQGSPD